MRDAIAVVLGLPAAVAGRLAPSGRRSSALRMTAVAAVVALLTIAALDTTTPPITAFKTTPVDPHAAARMAATVETDFGVNDAVVIDFSTAMDPAAVEAATSIQPAAADRVDLVERRQDPADPSPWRVGAGPVLHGHRRDLGRRRRLAPP